MDARKICLGMTMTLSLCSCAHYRWMNDRVSPQVAQQRLLNDQKECYANALNTVRPYVYYEHLESEERSETALVADRSCLAARGWTYTKAQVAAPSKGTVGGS
jgi:hypothetical protein